jgi:outer membrane protein
MGLLKSLVKIEALVVCCLFLGTALPPCLSADDSPWLFRARILGVIPDDSSTQISVIGGEADVDKAFTPDLDIVYFFNDNIAAELVFLAYARHDVEAKNTAVGNIDLGSLDLVPPTLTLQYHFMPENNIRPYVGAGLTYALIPNEDSGAATAVRYDDGVIGTTLQAGFDYFYNENWCVNFDIKKVWVNVDVEVDALGTTVDTSVDVDPWLIGIGIGYHF